MGYNENKDRLKYENRTFRYEWITTLILIAAMATAYIFAGS